MLISLILKAWISPSNDFITRCFMIDFLENEKRYVQDIQHLTPGDHARKTSRDPWRPLETKEDLQRPLETTGDQGRPVETLGDHWRPRKTSRDPWRPLSHK